MANVYFLCFSSVTNFSTESVQLNVLKTILKGKKLAIRAFNDYVTLKLSFLIQESKIRLLGLFFDVQSYEGLSSGFHLQSEMKNLRTWLFTTWGLLMLGLKILFFSSTMHKWGRTSNLTLAKTMFTLCRTKYNDLHRISIDWFFYGRVRINVSHFATLDTFKKTWDSNCYDSMYFRK